MEQKMEVEEPRIPWRLSEEEHEVEYVMDRMVENGQTFYRVKWRGYPHSRDTWETPETLVNAQRLIEQYESRRRKRQEKLNPKGRKITRDRSRGSIPSRPTMDTGGNIRAQLYGEIGGKTKRVTFRL
jgi:dTDP-glucose pyrophosphorylase